MALDRRGRRRPHRGGVIVLTGTPHFTLDEVALDSEWPIPAYYQDNAQSTLEALEALRAALGGGRLRLTSLWRSASANADTAGSVPNSRHLTAQAADFVPMDTTLDGVARAFAAAQAAGTINLFDQILIEPDHVHYDPGGVYGYRRQALVGDQTSGYVALVDWVQANPAAAGVAAGGSFPDRRGHRGMDSTSR